MTSPPAGFEFTNERPVAAEGRLIVRIPAKLNRKRRVLAEYARQLQFPSYFGWNWDAFEECLRDLSWLDGVQEIVIVHREVPFANSSEQQQTYLSILRDLVTNSDPYRRKFCVIFPRSGRQTVCQVLDDLREK